MIFPESVALEEIPRTTMKDIPSLVIEVLSPQDTYGKTVQRINQYLKRGIPLVWIVEPEIQTITVNRLDRTPVVFKANDTITGEEVFPDLQFKVAEFFRLPNQPTQADQS